MDIVQARRLARNTRPTRVVDSDYFPLMGGLNTEDPPLQVKPGELLGCLNYEAKTRGGYESMGGYERFDGRTRASRAAYALVKFVGGSPATYPPLGATITGPSGSGILLKLVVPVPPGSGTLVLGRFTGTMSIGQLIGADLFVVDVTEGATTNSADTDEADAEYRELAIADQRAQIGLVPGEGPVRGVAIYRGVAYAARNVAGNASARLWKASAGGWVECTLGRKLRFRAGSAQIAVGATLTGATSSASATVRRVVVTEGSWQAGTAKGYLIVPSVTGGPYSLNENLQVSATTIAVCDAADVAQTLLPNGRFEFRVHNFYGHAGTLRLYGVDGVNRGFEYQDSPEFFCEVETGMVTDAPKHVAVHKGRLWYAFPGGSIQFSGVNDAVLFSVLTGASEIGIGDEPTGFLEEVGDTLFIFSRNSTKFIAGSGPDFQLQTFNEETGALPWTIQRIGQGVYLDDRGYATLSTTDRFGNYAGNSISTAVGTLVDELKLGAIASGVSRSRDRYRCFFEGGRIVSLTFVDRRPASFTLCDYGRSARCTWSGEDATGAEMLLFGSDSGYVYVADSGNSFDGAAITTFLRLPFHHNRTPGRVKRYRRADLDIIANGACRLFIGVDYSYARPDVPADPTRMIDVLVGGGLWDISNWDEFRWNAGYVGQAVVKLEGSGVNVSFLVSSQSSTQPQHSVAGIGLKYSFRRMDRSTP